MCAITDFFVTLSSTQASFTKQDHAIQGIPVVFSDGADCSSGQENDFGTWLELRSWSCDAVVVAASWVGLQLIW